MQDRRIITDAGGAAILAAWGPMRLVIRAEKDGRPHVGAAREAAQTAFDCLARIAVWRRAFRRPALEITRRPPDSLAAAMVEAAAAIGDPDLTPMAAVAGVIADAVADELADRGMDKVVVDNGGDIAVRLCPGNSVRVGLPGTMGSPEMTGVLTLNAERAQWGIATSGMGGRSFTRGIASAVTTISRRTVTADAAATAVANACTVEDSAIVRQPAEQLDPDTDLAGLEVTVTVGALSGGQRRLAVAQAISKAETLRTAGIIQGCIVTLAELTETTGGIGHLITTPGKARGASTINRV